MIIGKAIKNTREKRIKKESSYDNHSWQNKYPAS